MLPDQTKTMAFQIIYDEEAVTVVVEVGATQNQSAPQRAKTLEEILKHQALNYEFQNGVFRIRFNGDSEVEKVLESFRIFEKQDKIKETKLNVHREIAAKVEERLKSIFPPPEAELELRHAAQ